MQIPRPLKLRQINATEGSKVHRFLAVAITGAKCRNVAHRAALISRSRTEGLMTKHIQPVPPENRSDKGPWNVPKVQLDDTKGHRDDEKHNIREQAAHGNLVQNTSNRRSG
jgi:hypothetical protein